MSQQHDSTGVKPKRAGRLCGGRVEFLGPEPVCRPLQCQGGRETGQSKPARAAHVEYARLHVTALATAD